MVERMRAIKSIKYRRVLNSHVQFTNEFLVELNDGSIGIGGSPRGETISIYEDRKVPTNAQSIIRAIEDDGCFGRECTQESFDAYLEERMAAFGRNNVFALSLAFLNATKASGLAPDPFDASDRVLSPPRICCNILNGGQHAYTNPVLSDFTEYLLVSTTNDIPAVIADHNEIQRAVKEKLLDQDKTVVGGNPVNRFTTVDNRECIDFLLGVVDQLGLSGKFELMIDASAGDLWIDGQYRFPVTGRAFPATEGLREYWMSLVRDYELKFLEDPFREEDFESWRYLTTAQNKCSVIGDNLYSSSERRIVEGSANRYSHGVVIKPDQSGTVTAARRALEAAERADQIIITSHRSISTESTFLSLLTCYYGVKYIKIGPLFTDYSSVVRLNEIIRLTGSPEWQ
jgi:enolase